jgi:hypothetical protein
MYLKVQTLHWHLSGEARSKDFEVRLARFCRKVTGLFRSRTPASPHFSSYLSTFVRIVPSLNYCDAPASPNRSSSFCPEITCNLILTSLVLLSQLKLACMLPNNTVGPGSGQQMPLMVPSKRRDRSQQDPNFSAKRAQVVAACQECRMKKRKVGRHMRRVRESDLRAWFLTQVITVRCTPSLHALCGSPPRLSICDRAWRNHSSSYEAKA